MNTKRIVPGDGVDEEDLLGQGDRNTWVDILTLSLAKIKIKKEHSSRQRSLRPLSKFRSISSRGLG